MPAAAECRRHGRRDGFLSPSDLNAKMQRPGSNPGPFAFSATLKTKTTTNERRAYIRRRLESHRGRQGETVLNYFPSPTWRLYSDCLCQYCDSGMQPLFTIGYEQAKPAAVLGELERAKIKLVVDTRAVAASRRPGFSKRQLAASLDEAGIAYLHLQKLGTPAEGRAGGALRRPRYALAHLRCAHQDAGGAGRARPN